MRASPRGAIRNQVSVISSRHSARGLSVGETHRSAWVSPSLREKIAAFAAQLRLRARASALCQLRPAADITLLGLPPLCAMCGRLRVGKAFLHVCRLVGAAMCSACSRGTQGRWP